jgi:hypothetical protein
MGILSDFFIAEKGTIPDYDGERDFPSEDRCQFRSITPLETAGILSVLRGGGDPVALLDAFPVLPRQDTEQWTMSVPEEMTEALAALDDSQIHDVAGRCSDITTEELGWSPAEFLEVVVQLRKLARRSVDQNKSIYLWNSL